VLNNVSRKSGRQIVRLFLLFVFLMLAPIGCGGSSGGKIIAPENPKPLPAQGTFKSQGAPSAQGETRDRMLER
jgi:hypothetical protein